MTHRAITDIIGLHKKAAHERQVPKMPKVNEFCRSIKKRKVEP